MSRAGGLEGQGFVLNVNKQSAWTSHDAVQRVRRILNFRKVGHTGTLDPFATGVLLCCVGRATKLSNLLMDLPKQYEGWMRFGLKTDTGDLSGRIKREWSGNVPSLETLREASRVLQGEIMQVPPMVSALKHEGQRLYRLARKGITVQREPRRVSVESFEILQLKERLIRFRVRCGRGTYVRTLVDDFGASLGAGACVRDLCRTRVGRFRVEDAVSLEEMDKADDLIAHSIPMAEAVNHLPAWKVPPFWVVKLRRGHSPPWVVLQMERPPEPGETGRLVDGAGQLEALARAEAVPGSAERAWYDALELRLLRVI